MCLARLIVAINRRAQIGLRFMPVMMADLFFEIFPGRLLEFSSGVYLGNGITVTRGWVANHRHPDTVGALFFEEFGYYRWPDVAPTWGQEAVVAQRAGTHHQWRTIGALNALTGQVNYLAGYSVGRRQVIQFYGQLTQTYAELDRLYVIHDNWNIHTHPDVLTVIARYPRLIPVWMPTYSPWLNPIEKLWRWLRQDVLKMHRWVEDWPHVKKRVHDFLDQFAQGSPDLLRYVGLAGKGKLATVINSS